MASVNGRKRPAPESTEEDFRTADLSPEPPAKRPRYSEDSRVSSSTKSLDQSISLITPPSSVRSIQKRQTISLKLEIPKHTPSTKEIREVAARKGAAKRWANAGKLRRAPPSTKEVKNAYPLKLMRHYPAATPRKAGASTAVTPTPTPGFIKPQIKKSSRVMKLLKSYPTINIPPSPADTNVSRAIHSYETKVLDKNRKNITSEHSGRIAWQSFAEPDRSTREVMVESALPTEELEKEYHGEANTLPEWKKHTTGKFCESTTVFVDLT